MHPSLSTAFIQQPPRTANPSNGLRCGRGDKIINRRQRPASLATLPTSSFDQRRRQFESYMCVQRTMTLHWCGGRFSMVWNNFWKPAARIALELQQYRRIEQRIVAAALRSPTRSFALLPLARMPPARHSFRFCFSYNISVNKCWWWWWSIELKPLSTGARPFKIISQPPLISPCVYFHSLMCQWQRPTFINFIIEFRRWSGANFFILRERCVCALVMMRLIQRRALENSP